MDEDRSRNRTGNSIENLSTIRKIVFNLARLDKSMGEKLTLKQKMTRYTSNFQNIENLIFNAISYTSWHYYVKFLCDCHTIQTSGFGSF